MRYLVFAGVYNSDTAVRPMRLPSGTPVEPYYHLTTVEAELMTPPPRSSAFAGPPRAPSPTTSVFALSEISDISRGYPGPSSNPFTDGIGFSQSEKDSIISNALYMALAERSQQNHRSMLRLILSFARTDRLSKQRPSPFETAAGRGNCEVPARNHGTPRTKLPFVIARGTQAVRGGRPRSPPAPSRRMAPRTMRRGLARGLGRPLKSSWPPKDRWTQRCPLTSESATLRSRRRADVTITP
jgi:hypothetical protein